MKEQKKYKGVIIPAVTPLTKDYDLDHAAVEKMFAHFHKHGAMPFVLGTTGEAASIPLPVKRAYIKAAVKYKSPGMVLYGGISSNSLQESVELAAECFDNGVDVVAATLPTYYALPESGMQKYFEQLADKVAGPLVIYNIPATTHMSIPLPVIDALSHHPNIVGTKDSERSEERLKVSLTLWSRRQDFSHFLGWAAKSATALMGGGDGLIPSTGNFFPGIYSEMYKAVQDGDQEKALQMQYLSDVFGNVYQQGRLLGQSLAALKAIMKKTGLCDKYMMPPLQELSEQEETALLQEVANIMKEEKIMSF
jgi:dihydrodipicolinate synthase/N-acetylneuraminate lyase